MTEVSEPIPFASEGHADIEDGLHFSLDEDEYHGLPAISSAGIKHLLVSPMNFWARSWMNPVRSVEEDS